MQVKDLPDSYTLIDDPDDIKHILDSVGVTDQYGCIFVKVGNAEYDSIYGIDRNIPYLEEYLELVYNRSND